MQSKYISLQDLKGMDDGQIYTRWLSGRFPFDVADCSNCATQHKFPGHITCQKHGEFSKQANAVLSDYPTQELRQNLEAIYSLRLFFKDLYKNNPPEIMEQESTEAAGLPAVEHATK